MAFASCCRRELFLICFVTFGLASAQPRPTWKQYVGEQPPDRCCEAMVFDAQRGQVVMFGGYSPSGGVLSDTWVWDGTQWSRKSPANRPPARAGHAMAFDATRGEVVLFGGQTALVGFVNYLRDTWVWDGSNWTQKSPAQSPPAMGQTAMAYDAANAKVVLHGGCNAAGAFGDTWTWDGNNWTQSSATGPGRRDSLSMFYDSARGRVVLFGGENNGNFLNDTWTWNGSSWTAVPGATPPARILAATAYDATEKKAVLFGGIAPDFRTLLSDTWMWDGASWSQASTANSPAARFDTAMAYDAARGQTILFGGSLTNNRSTVSGETWLFSTGAAAPVVSLVQSAGAFGAFPNTAPGEWVEIFGSNLAGGSRSWTTADFRGSLAPTSLDDVRVTIGGVPAFVQFIRPDQVNILVPSGVPAGPQPLVVTNGDVSSAPYTVTVRDIQPAFVSPPSFQLNGRQYVAALFSDGFTYVIPSGAIAGVNSRPAKPGETIVIYGINFGDVSPNIPVGQIAGGPNQLARPFQVKFGSVPAQLSYFGLVPNYVGLYQFNVIVPDIPDSDAVPVTFTLDGTPGTQTLVTAVRR